MRLFSAKISFLAILCCGLFGLGGSAAQAQRTGDLVAQIGVARQDVELARDRLRFYQNDEYPAQIRRLDHAIEMALATERAFSRRIFDYEGFERWKYSRPFHYSLEEQRLAHLHALHVLEELQDERFLYIRDHSNRYRLLERDVKAAEERLRSLFAALNAEK